LHCNQEIKHPVQISATDSSLRQKFIQLGNGINLVRPKAVFTGANGPPGTNPSKPHSVALQ